MFCELCRDKNCGPEHDISPKHIKNRILYEFHQNKKQYSGNRKGVKILCNVVSTGTALVNCADGKIKISAKPGESIKFSFTVENETNSEEILIVGIQLAHTNLGFVINDHGLNMGEDPYLLNPKHFVPREIEVTFANSDVGQYDLPIMFFFQKRQTNESLVIIREMMVFVERLPVVHEKTPSPFADKEVRADKLYPSHKTIRNDSTFRIPKTYKHVFSSYLQMPTTATEQDKAVADAIKESFETGITDDNYVKFFHNLLWYEEAIVRINLKKYNMSDVPLGKSDTFYLLNVPGLAEKRPSLILGDIVFVRPHDDESVMFEGVIVKIESNFASIAGLDPHFAEKYRTNKTFDVRFFLSRMPLERMHRAVDSLFKVSQRSRVFPQQNDALVNVEPIRSFYNQQVASNAEQRRAVEHIVSGSSGRAPYILHGPPGTGKTVTIVEAILQLVKRDATNHILVCTDSNMAADHVALMLIKYHAQFDNNKQFLLRANSSFRTWETLPVALEQYSNGTSCLSFKNVSNAVMDSYRIVVTTLSHAAKFARSFNQGRPVTHLFIDEAAQASEPASLIPVCGLLQTQGHLILAGDPKQLGPVLISHHAKRIGLGKSLMERLKDGCVLYDEERNDARYGIMLRNNFRSHPDILEIPNEMFYGGNLRAHAPILPLSHTDILGSASESRAIVFHGVRSKEQRVGKSPSYFNNMELEVVQSYIIALTERHGVAPEDIGIVTPYIRQVYKVKEWLHSRGLGNRLEAGTVEAFQGKEKLVVVVSTVRASCGLLDHDARFQLGFLVDDKRFNVALTRAKAKAIVIGNPLCLMNDVKWREYMDRCKQYGTYFGYDAAIERNDEVEHDLIEKLKSLKAITNEKVDPPKKSCYRPRRRNRKPAAE